MIHHQCPVCWQDVNPTTRGKIAAHNTSIRTRCPGMGLPWTLTRYVENGIAFEEIA